MLENIEERKDFEKGKTHLTHDEIKYLIEIRKNGGEGIFRGVPFITRLWDECSKGVCQFCVLKDYQCDKALKSYMVPCIDKSKFIDFLMYDKWLSTPEGIDSKYQNHFTQEEQEYIYNLREHGGRGTFRGESFIVNPGQLCEYINCKDCVLNGFPCKLTDCGMQDMVPPCEKI